MREALSLELRTEFLELPYRDPFQIARREDSGSSQTVIVELTIDGISGLGEAFPVAYYGETPETIVAVLPRLRDALKTIGPLPADVSSAHDWLERSSALMAGSLGGHGGAKAGLDIALHDVVGKALGKPVWELLGTDSLTPPTDYSLGIDEPARVAERARSVADFPALKIKLGGPQDVATLEAVRAVYPGPLRVDANTGWQAEEALTLVPDLERLGVELIEQPFPARHLDELRRLSERTEVPILADESAVFEDDLAMLRGVVDGVVVKLAKCGGIGPALRMIRRAHELDLKVMLGCMVETSLGIAAAAAVASEVDWLDLDGNLLLADDPFTGLELTSERRWQLPTTAGLGVTRRPLA